jgi:hypothetical protein
MHHRQGQGQHPTRVPPLCAVTPSPARRMEAQATQRCPHLMLIKARRYSRTTRVACDNDIARAPLVGGKQIKNTS